mmetsp:Transcript_26898/g.72524  ORF Transcript_26898/g.72524 Transcript_26898/m.72524 type:complete len:299 (-) Transcript_26898:363-1259(-)
MPLGGGISLAAAPALAPLRATTLLALVAVGPGLRSGTAGAASACAAGATPAICKTRSAWRAAPGETRPMAPRTMRGPTALARSTSATTPNATTESACTAKEGTKKLGIQLSTSRATTSPSTAIIHTGAFGLATRASCACLAPRYCVRASRMRFCNRPTRVASSTSMTAGWRPSAGASASRSSTLVAASWAAWHSALTSSLRCHTRGRLCSSNLKRLSNLRRIFSCTCSASPRAADTIALRLATSSSRTAASRGAPSTRRASRSALSSRVALRRAEARPLARRAQRSTGVCLSTATALG